MPACVELEFGPGDGGGGAGGGGSGGCNGDCNDENPCTQDVCNPGGTCEHPAATVFTLAQTTGDCQSAVCDGTTLSSEDDDSDLPGDDGNVCTDEVCDNGSPVHPPVADGALCDGGTCVSGMCSSSSECADDADCSGAIDQCVGNVCVDCDFASGGDVGCSGADDQCVPGNTCVDCDATGGCAAADQCDTATNTCVDCVTDAGCSTQAPLDQCVDNVCRNCDFASGTDAGCSGTNDQCVPGNSCVDCDGTAGPSGAGCGSGDQCTGGNVCVDCVNNMGCSGGTPHCRTETNMCVQCLGNGHCPMVAPICSQITFTCVP